MKKKLLNVIAITGIVIYILFGTDFLSDIKKSSASAINIIKETEKIGINGELSVHFIDVGEADSILIRLEEYNMLIDAGNNEDGQKLVKYFKSLGIDNFDYVVATHPHEDHIGGMDDVINNFNIKNFYMPDAYATSKTFEDMLDALANKNLKYEVPVEDGKYNLGDAEIETLYIGKAESDLNDSSIVLRLSFGENSFLFTGDVSGKVEKRLVNKNIESDVLKVGHHGSSYSTSDEFLNKVNPKFAVISVGKNNIYNHPSIDTINKLGKVKLYRTDELGTIIFNSDGKNITVKTVNTNTNG